LGPCKPVYRCKTGSGTGASLFPEAALNRHQFSKGVLLGVLV
jgi:hypothetical protein